MDLGDVIAGWQTKLLQLDRRNPLIYFRGKRSSVSIVEVQPDVLLERLQHSRKGLTFPFAEKRRAGRSRDLFEDDDGETEDSLVELSGDLKCEGSTVALQGQLLNLQRKDRLWEEEQGVNVLFLALGFLDWIDQDGQAASAPLLLAPADLERDSPRDAWRLHLEEEDLQTNETLRYVLGKLGIELPVLAEEPEPPSGYLARVGRAIASKSEWSVSPRCALATFPFAKMSMWQDLERMRVQGTDHAVVTALGGDVGALRPSEFGAPAPLPGAESLKGGGLDDLLPVKDQFTVLDADHSQLRAIELVRRGGHVVIHGPPGTGKSQTIANVIATLLADGKRVLFVSEKTAALDVVKSRLADCRLDVFCLDLHSDRARKASVYEQLRRSLKAGRSGAQPFPLSRLEQQRSDLNEVARALHEVRAPLQLSVFQVHGRYSRVRVLDRVDFPLSNVAALSARDLEQILKTTGLVARRGSEFVAHATSPWRALRRETWSVELADDVREIASAMHRATTNCRIALDAQADHLGLPRPAYAADGARLAAVALHLAEAPGVPAAWIDADQLKRLTERARERAAAQSQQRALRASLEPFFGAELPALPFRALVESLALQVGDAECLVVVLGAAWGTALCPRPVAAAERLSTTVRQIQEVQDALSGLLTDGLARISALDAPEARAIAVALRTGLAARAVPEQWTREGGLAAARDATAAASREAAALAETERRLFADFDERVLDLATEDLLVRLRTDHQRFFRILTKSYRADMRALRGCLRAPRKLAVEEALAVVGGARNVIARRNAWAARKAEFEAALGDRFHDRATDWASVQKEIDAIEELRRGWRWGDDTLAPLLADVAVRARLEPKLERLETALRATAAAPNASALLDRIPRLDDAVGSAAVGLAIVRRLVEAGEALWPTMGTGAASWSELHDVLASAALLQRLVAEEEAVASDLGTEFGTHYRGDDTDWERATRALQWTSEFLELVREQVSPEVVRHCQAPAPSQEYRQRAAAVREARSCFDDQARSFTESFDPAAAGWDSWETAAFAHLETWVAWVRDHADSVGEWFEYTRAEAALDGILGKGVLGVLRAATDDATKVPDLVLRRVYAAWLDAQYGSDERLRFQPRDHEALRAEFRKLDGEFSSANRSRVRQRCFGAYPDEHNISFQYGQLGTLNHELSKKKRQLPVRKLIQQVPQLLQALKPCFLMSPIAVSQYLPRDESESIAFDAVVFDEASQVFPQDAVPAIARGKQVVVVGDQKQLPPTSFFRSAMDDDDVDEDIDDRLEGVESILDAMVGMAGTGVHDAYLAVHYRSRHDELIRYSNHHFYEDRLLTFPSPLRSAPWLGLKDVYLAHGRYDAGATKTNRAEAEEVVERVWELMRTRPVRESVGVVTLSRVQADLIDELINLRRLTDSSLDQRFAEDRHERFFVKNLENVQGDERDHILLSLGYGPTVGSGQVPNRFGPINREGGERRLNVAVSRARRSLTLIRSLRADHITSEAAGARLLRRFLEYAQNPERAFEAEIDVDPAAETESPFEEAVFRALTRRGHKVARQIGCLGYRIDLAISSDDGSRFDLGIECDGATYHSTPAARDRDWLRQNVLEGLGWTIHRIWSTDWIKNPDRQVEFVEAALVEARASRVEELAEFEEAGDARWSNSSSESGESDDGERVREDVASAADECAALGVEPLELFEVREGSRGRWSIVEETGSRLRDLVVRIVEVQGPVHEDDIIDVIRRIYGAGRAGRQIRAAISSAIDDAHRRGEVARRASVDGQRKGPFVDRPKRPHRVPPRGPAADGTVRKIERVWPGEIEEVLLRAIDSSFGIDPDGAITFAARALGFQRVGASIREVFENTLSQLLARGEIQDTGAGLTRPRTE